MNKSSPFPVNFSYFIGAILALLLGGCGTGGQIPRDLMSDEARAESKGERPVAMRGEGTFLDGKLAAFATISRGFDRGAKEGARPGGDRGGRRRRGDDIAESYPVSFGDSEEEQKEAMEEYMRQIKARRRPTSRRIR